MLTIFRGFYEVLTWKWQCSSVHPRKQPELGNVFHSSRRFLSMHMLYIATSLVLSRTNIAKHKDCWKWYYDYHHYYYCCYDYYCYYYYCCCCCCCCWWWWYFLFYSNQEKVFLSHICRKRLFRPLVYKFFTKWNTLKY